jgi:catechol 2,3-dioxygenase-like lactoylglutathione lyase family enzyme
MQKTSTPVLDGIHHLKLPVTDLAGSLDWYRSRLGYEVQLEFVEQGTLMGVALTHPAGGPDLGLRLDPDRARAAAGFDYFIIGVPDRAAIGELARRLDELGQPHAGVHRATLGWILPEVLDPDGHTLRFYTKAHHTDVVAGETATIHDPRETAERRERAEEEQQKELQAARPLP